MNETAAGERPKVWIGSKRLVFRGVLPNLLDWHRHPFHCVLLAAERPFEVELGDGTHACRALLVPGGQAHCLRFDGHDMLSMYIPPHDDGFASLAASARGHERGAITEWSEQWWLALRQWNTELDPGPLNDAIRRTWASGSTSLDARVRSLTHELARGRCLGDSPKTLASAVGLSASRLAHLVKEHTGSSIGEVQRAYKFTAAARSMVTAKSFTRAAHAAEFADSAHFSRSFRAAYGLAPSRILARTTRWTLHDRL
ncbi:MAG: helix-turn-helix transcriptional regulator [Acidobacteriota bacterium]|nr:helix-turn-helix transcriptional regulator [Acidobacteriota bacterium]